jgi:tRNA threonylcarbamoyladenosine biosynthesis protein TsaE
MDVSLDALPDFATQFVTELPTVLGTNAHVVGLSGDLGAGKTTFVQSVAQALGCERVVTSPTFVLAQRYATTRAPFASLIHIDAYRLKPDEVHTIGWARFYADPTNLILIEWPEKLVGLIPPDAPVLNFTVVDETHRTISYA